MIAGLTGKIAGKSADSLLVNVGGVVYRVGTSSQTLNSAGEVGDDIRVHTHLVVREDQLALFGFANQDELRLFETLVTVNGIGPRLACAILSKFPVSELSQTIEAGNADLLATVSGVGKKTAARLIVDLRGKLPTANESAAPSGIPEPDVVEALQALGYTVGEATLALSRLPQRDSEPVEERVVRALQALGEG